MTKIVSVQCEQRHDGRNLEHTLDSLHLSFHMMDTCNRLREILCKILIKKVQKCSKRT